MRKLSIFLDRLKNGSFRRMAMYAGKAARDSGRSTTGVFTDMAWCILRYGVGYLDYLVFGFQFCRGACRKTFMTYDDNVRLVRLCNDRDEREVYENKLRFCRAFSDLIGRDTIDISAASEEEFARFLKGKRDVFAKTPDGFGGLSVRHVPLTSKTDVAALYNELCAGHFFDVEEAIVQHEGMSALCADSVNTIRIVTLLNEAGEAVPMYALVRMGFGGKRVDNISSGGMYAPCDLETGELYAKAFCDKLGEYYEHHPATGTRIVGHRVPMFAEALALVKKAAERTPKVRYIGWDVAIAKDGPVLVEGNTLPGYDMCQNYYHQKVKGEGLLPRFRAVAGRF